MTRHKGSLNKKCGSREAILQLLQKRPHYTTEIIAKTGYEPRAIGLQLNTLQKLGYTTKEPRGRYMYYSISALYKFKTHHQRIEEILREVSKPAEVMSQHVARMESLVQPLIERYKEMDKLIKTPEAQEILKSEGINPKNIPVTLEALKSLKHWSKEYHTIQRLGREKKFGYRKYHEIEVEPPEFEKTGDA